MFIREYNNIKKIKKYKIEHIRVLQQRQKNELYNKKLFNALCILLFLSFSDYANAADNIDDADSQKVAEELNAVLKNGGKTKIMLKFLLEKHKVSILLPGKYNKVETFDNPIKRENIGEVISG